MSDLLKLPFQFDPDALKNDLSRIASEEWMPHFNTAIYEGDWAGVSLRSVGGRPAQIYPDPTAQGKFADTGLLERCPYFQQILATFHCPLLAVRLLRLSARSSIREHRDYKLGFEDGEIRLHIPVVTDSYVKFYLKGERVVMAEGECWYLDLNLPHRIDNESDQDRIHLVIDCEVNAWLQTFFPATMSVRPSPFLLETAP